MSSRHVYLVTSLLAFLSALLVFTADVVWPRHWLCLITAALEVIVLVVTSTTVLRPLGRSALLLRAISVLIAVEALVPVVLPVRRGDTMLSASMLLLTALGIMVFGVYAVLTFHLRTFKDPSVRLFNLHCKLRICGMALFLLGNIATLFYVAGQVVLGILLFRCASRPLSGKLRETQGRTADCAATR